MIRRLVRYLLQILVWLILLSILIVWMGRWIDPTNTALMFERRVQAWWAQEPLEIRHRWQDWDQLSEALKVAVLAAEDQKFMDHRGFDLEAIQAALAYNRQGKSVRGASTLTQQLAKNLFLWSDRSWLRKGIEAWFTFLLESFWSKQRIFEVYLNSVEWGEGIFGAEAASQHYFGISARALNAQQASLLAAILPNPRHWSASQPSAYVTRKSAWIRQQVHQLGGSQYLRPLHAN